MKQHYVPQFYLRNFGESIFGADKTTGDTFPTTPKRVAFKSDFYGPTIDGKQPLEKALSNLEKKSSISIGEIISKNDIHDISFENFRNFCKFLGMQYIRTPETRTMIGESVDNISNLIAKEKISEWDGINLKDQVLGDGDKLGIHLSLLRDYYIFATIMMHMKFVTIRNHTNIPFWTSDHPLALRNECVQPPFSNLGLVCKGIEVHLPITPTLSILACDPYYFREMPSIIDEYNEKNVIKENTLQVRRSTRFLYSNTDKFHNLHDMLIKHTKLQDPSRTRSHFNEMSGKELIDKKIDVWPHQKLLDFIFQHSRDYPKSTKLKNDGQYLVSGLINDESIHT